ncbi:MAG: hypothetical protein ACYTGX_07895 [Planctomycetota bacterium]|jgi:hypothetical protein
MRGFAALAVATLLAVPASAQEEGERPPLPLPPLPELMQKLVTDTAREYEFTRYHLHRHGAAAVPALRTVLAGESVKRRWRAAQVLEAIGPDAEAALPDCVQAMKWEPAKGREGGPGELDGLRSAAYRLCGRLGHRQALGVAKSQVAIEIKRIAKLTGDDAKAGTAAGWLPAAIGCWLELGGASARKALAKQVSATAKWQSVSPQGLLAAVGASRHPDLIPVLAAVCDAADVEIRAVKLRNDKRMARAERLEKPPEGLETPGPAKPMALAALRAAASPDGEDSMRNGGAWAAWHESNAKWLYYSVTDRELRVDTEAREAGVPTAKYRADHPWEDRQGPHPPLEEPAFAGGIPRLRPGEEPHDLPGEGHKDG